MNGNNELSAGHFWDSMEAEKEYHAVGRGIAEAKEKLKQMQARQLTVQAVFDRFWDTPGIAAVEDRGISYRYRGTLYGLLEENILDHLNEALNPYWLPDEGGKFEFGYSHGYRHSHTPWQGSLVVSKVVSETLQGAAVYGREKKRTGAYVHLRITYSYDKRVEWYTPTGDVGMSGLEHSLRSAASPFKTPNSLYDKLLDEVKQEVYAFLAPLCREVVLKFIPDLGPTNVAEIEYSHGIYKEDDPELVWPPLARYKAPKAGERYGLASYKGICWVCCGRWEPYQFPKATLRYVRERIARIFDHLRERIANEARQVVRVEEEIASLRRRQDKIRILHYKPDVYKAFWSAMQTAERQDFD